MSEVGVLETVTISYRSWVQKLFITSNTKTIQYALSVLKRNWKPSRVNTITHSNGLIRKDHMHAVAYPGILFGGFNKFS
jgi:hypothetical protein